MAVFKCTACPDDDTCILYFAGNLPAGEFNPPEVCPIDGGTASWEHLDPEAPA